eukprot:gnl/MRDRNA2_/MRDRNA2_16480_c0_seq1.p1 gnl/MRDRNA2_/MRDRNA2_16480_c0~~gnl/MRDRNA2_/MRDRNA2_16480_c0_seq1.p1  ORF type:complete len:430 (+),score=67.08 gnl/MRDRNA2_/MRDRNA2_16480_c0_seq1:154-1443(+)
MMRSDVLLVVHVLFAFFGKCSAGAQINMQGCLDRGFNDLDGFNKLSNRALQTHLWYGASLDKATLQKPKHGVIPSSRLAESMKPIVKMQGLSNPRVAHISHQRSPPCMASTKEDDEELKKMGIDVETPEDRVRRREEISALNNIEVGMPGTRSFKYVCIPADDNLPISEQTGTVYADQEGDKLPLILASTFAAGDLDPQAVKQANVMAMSQQKLTPNVTLPTLTEEVIRNYGGSAEKITLSRAVTMYIDEIGTMKRLPPNSRAAALASRCGYGEGLPLHGDVFVGRIDKDTKQNVDFTFDDMAWDAPWINRAVAENMEDQEGKSIQKTGKTAQELATAGGDGDGYTWRQTKDAVDIVVVNLPPGTRGKDLTVKFETEKVTVVSEDYSLVLDLFAAVRPDQSIWSIMDGEMELSLAKSMPGETWPGLIKK